MTNSKITGIDTNSIDDINCKVVSIYNESETGLHREEKEDSNKNKMNAFVVRELHHFILR